LISGIRSLSAYVCQASSKQAAEGVSASHIRQECRNFLQSNVIPFEQK
jgi:hypothetical protein